MRYNFKDMIGQRFGRLLVMERSAHIGGKAHWVCRCDCGTVKTILGICLRRGESTSCGCFSRMVTSERSRTHGYSRTPIYRIWGLMIDRCTNPNSPNFQTYGERGIQVCERWRKFERFLADMGERPSPKHSIERVNNNGNYEPQNCRWVTRTEQARNRRTSRLLTLKDETRTVAEWVEITGINSTTIRQRIDSYGWSVERALTTSAS